MMGESQNKRQRNVNRAKKYGNCGFSWYVSRFSCFELVTGTRWFDRYLKVIIPGWVWDWSHTYVFTWRRRSFSRSLRHINGVLHPLRIPNFITIVIRETSTADARRGGRVLPVMAGRCRCWYQQMVKLHLMGRSRTGAGQVMKVEATGSKAGIGFCHGPLYWLDM